MDTKGRKRETVKYWPTLEDIFSIEDISSINETTKELLRRTRDINKIPFTQNERIIVQKLEERLWNHYDFDNDTDYNAFLDAILREGPRELVKEPKISELKEKLETAFNELRSLLEEEFRQVITDPVLKGHFERIQNRLAVLESVSKENFLSNITAASLEQSPPEKNILSTVRCVSEDRQPELFALVKEFAEKAKHEPEKPLPKPGSYEYRKSQPYTRISKTEIKKFVGDVWGHWLKEFTPALDRDYMSQADLRKLDPQLLDRLKKNFTKDELNDFIPTLPTLTMQKAMQMTPQEIQDIQKKIGWVYKRSLEGN